MTAIGLLAYEIENTGYQLSACFKELPEEVRDAKLTDQGMSPRETATHLCESYLAVAAQAQGLKYEWGSFSAEGLEWEDLMATLSSYRDRAAFIVCVDDDGKLKSGHDYMVAHDAYHVGQLCQLRIRFQPDWEPYSIYRFRAKAKEAIAKPGWRTGALAKRLHQIEQTPLNLPSRDRGISKLFPLSSNREAEEGHTSRDALDAN